MFKVKDAGLQLRMATAFDVSAETTMMEDHKVGLSISCR